MTTVRVGIPTRPAPAAVAARPVRALAGSRGRDTLARLAPGAFGAVLALTWFEPGRFLGAGDVSPLVRRSLEAEAGTLWNHQTSGAGATTPDAGRAVEALLVRLVRVVGGDELLAQRILLAAVVAVAALGAAQLAARLVRRPGSIAVAGVLAVLNPFILLQVPNPLFPLAVGTIGLLGAAAIDAGRRRPVRAVRVVLASLPLAYLSINPALLGVAVVAVAAAGLVAAAAPGGSWRALAGAAARSGPVLVLVHLWWLVPLAEVTFGGPQGVVFAAVTDPDSWSWAVAENSLGRVATLTAHWGWPHPEVFPWAGSMDRWPWPALRWALPLGALAGGCLPLGGRALGPGARWARRALVAGALVLVVASQGLHAPAAPLNRLLYEHVPGAWLLREPVSKLGPPLVLVLVLLVAVLVEAALERAASRQGQALAAIAAVVVLAAAAHPWPLLTGDVAPDERATLPSVHVAVPGAWDELAAAVDRSDAAGKVAVLPLNANYQVSTSWGYHGVDLVPQLLARPALVRLPGGYYGERPGFDALLEALQARVLAGDAQAVPPLLDALGASHLIVRRDLVAAPGGERLVDIAALEAGAAAVPGLRAVLATPVGVLYERPGDARVRVVAGLTASSAAVADHAVTGDRAVTTAEDVAVDALAHPVVLPSAAGVELREAGRYRVALTAAGLVAATARLEATGAGPVVVLEPAADLRVDGTAVDLGALARLPVGEGDVVLTAGGTSHVLLGERPVLVAAGERVAARSSDGTASTATVRVEAAAATLTLDAGRHVLETAGGSTSVLGAVGPLLDCARTDGRTPAEAGLAAVPLADGVRLEATDHSACVAAPVSATPGDTLLVGFTVGSAGIAPRICLWQTGVDRCAPLPDPPASGPYQAVATTDPAATGFELYLYADGGGDARAVEYRALEVTTAGTGLLLEREDGWPQPLPTVTVLAEEPGALRLAVAGADGPFVLVVPESHAPGWRLDGLPDGWTAEHVEVDGYANGWRVHGDGDAVLTARYAPGGTTAVAATVSPLALAAVLLGTAVGSARRRARRGGPLSPRAGAAPGPR